MKDDYMEENHYKIIASILTDDEKKFIDYYDIDYYDIYDARGLKPKERHDNAKEKNCNYVIAGYCYNGHRLKTRNGHCIQCNTARITFQNRNSRSGVIYVAENGDYCKVGVVDNNINNIDMAIHNREIRLNLEGGYGGMTGWKIVAYTPVGHNLGKIENSIHEKMSKYSVISDYWYSGEMRVAEEMFKCEYDIAVDLIDDSIECKWTFA